MKAAYDQRTMAMIRERGITLEICPTSNLNTRVVSGWDEFRWIFDTFRRNEVRYTINTDGPEMLKTYIRDELTSLARLGILSVEEQVQAAEWAREASFVAGVARVCRCPAARPATRARSSARRPDARRSTPDREARRAYRSASGLLERGLAVDAADGPRRERAAGDRRGASISSSGRPSRIARDEARRRSGRRRPSNSTTWARIGRQPQGLLAADREGPRRAELDDHGRAGRRPCPPGRLRPRDQRMRRVERIGLSGDQGGLPLVREEDVRAREQAVDALPAPARGPSSCRTSSSRQRPARQPKSAGSPGRSLGWMAVEPAWMWRTCGRTSRGTSSARSRSMVPVAVSRARRSPLPRTTVAPVGMAGSTEMVDVSTPRAAQLLHDASAEEVVADDAAVSDAQPQTSQPAGGDGRGAAHGEPDGAHQLLDLAELGRDIVTDDEDVGVDVADDVDVDDPLIRLPARWPREPRPAHAG